MKIADEYVEMLRSHGLFVNNPMPSGHVFPDGVLVGKPKTVAGNTIPNYSTGFVLNLEKDERVEFDAPPVWLYGHGGVWVVLAEEYCPGPGPGDFLDEWDSPEAAVKDILDFYFGDPRRMQAKDEARKKPVRMGDTERPDRESA
jgi:hypothetical protein